MIEYYFCIRSNFGYKKMSKVVEPDKLNANLTESGPKVQGAKRKRTK